MTVVPPSLQQLEIVGAIPQPVTASSEKLYYVNLVIHVTYNQYL
jgi:hypothetical protein